MGSPKGDFDKFVSQNNLFGILSGNMRPDEKQDSEDLAAALQEVERQKCRRAQERSEYEARLKDLEGLVQTRNLSHESPNSGNGSVRLEALAQAIATLQGSVTELRQNDQQNHLISLASAQCVISEFHGNEGPERARAWMNQLKNTKELYSWNDAIALSIVKSRLRNAAWKWLMTKTDVIKTFENLKVTFEATFTYKRTRSAKLKEMTARSQGQKESLQDYVLDKVWLCDGLEFSVSEQRDEIAAGLWSRELVAKIHNGRRERISEHRERRVVPKDKTTQSSGGGSGVLVPWNGRAGETGNATAPSPQQ